MARKGRPRKPGRRTDRDKPIRTPQAHDKGNERVQALRERYGEHYSTALGRAYAAGLLGEETLARVRYDAGKRFQRAVERFFEVGRVKCPLGQRMRSGGPAVQLAANSYEDDEWQWVCDMADRLGQAGLRQWLDQLTLSRYHDADPYWLAALLDGGKHPADVAVLNTVIKALDMIAPEAPRVTIRVVR